MLNIVKAGNPYQAFIFFVIIIMVCVFFFMNLIVALFVDQIQMQAILERRIKQNLTKSQAFLLDKLPKEGT
jgi:hypothetical protein